MALSKYGGITGSKKISEDFENINAAFNKVAADVDTKAAAASPALTGTPTAPTQPVGDNSTKIATTQYVDRAAGAVEADLDTHVADKVAHLTKEEHDKLTGVESGAQKNQNAFTKVNGLQAATPTDGFSIVGDVGIDVTTNPIDKSIHLTVNGESAPGKHGPTHDIGGSDPIPGLVQAVTDSHDAKTMASEALSTAQAAVTAANQYTDDKVSPIQSSLTTHTAAKVHSAEVHGLRVSDDKFQFQKADGNWQVVSGGMESTTENVTYYVNVVTGSDINNGVSGSTPFKTIAKAIAMIPPLVNHNVTINVAAGTYPETINLNNFSGTGKIQFNGGTDLNPTTHVIDRFSIRFCNVNIQINGFYTATTTNSSVTNSFGVEILNCSFVATGYLGLSVTTSVVKISKNVFSNKDIAISASFYSGVISSNNSGTGNKVVLNAYDGGTITKFGTQPSGTTAESTSTGGVIK